MSSNIPYARDLLKQARKAKTLEDCKRLIRKAEPYLTRTVLKHNRTKKNVTTKHRIELIKRLFRRFPNTSLQDVEIATRVGMGPAAGARVSEIRHGKYGAI